MFFNMIRYPFDKNCILKKFLIITLTHNDSQIVRVKLQTTKLIEESLIISGKANISSSFFFFGLFVFCLFFPTYFY